MSTTDLLETTALTAPTGLSTDNTIARLEICGEYDPSDLHPFVARFRGLTELSLAISNREGDVGEVLGAIDPLLLRRLSIVTPDWFDGDLELDISDLTPLTNLHSLVLPNATFHTEFIASLSALTKLNEIGTLPHELDFLSASDTVIFLDPLTRPPAPRSLDFEVVSWVESKTGGGSRIACYNRTDWGVGLPIWPDGWTADSAAEVLELAAQQGIEFSGRENCEKAIAMTAEFTRRWT